MVENGQKKILRPEENTVGFVMYPVLQLSKPDDLGFDTFVGTSFIFSALLLLYEHGGLVGRKSKSGCVKKSLTELGKLMPVSCETTSRICRMERNSWKPHRCTWLVRKAKGWTSPWKAGSAMHWDMCANVSKHLVPYLVHCIVTNWCWIHWSGSTNRLRWKKAKRK